MDAVLQSFMSGFPVLMLHSSVTLAILAVGVTVYVIPLAFAMSASVNVLDIVVWGGVTVILQLLAFKITDLLLRDLPRRIEAGEVGPALVLVAIKLAVAAVNAAAVSG